MSDLEYVKFDIVGMDTREERVRYPVIGEAVFCFEIFGLTNRAGFVLTIRRPPGNFYKTFLVPQDAVLSEQFATKFRVCDSSDEDDGGCFIYGLAMLVPTRGELCHDSYYFEMEPDYGGLLWQCGTFVARLDPHDLPDFFTISDAA